MRNLYKQRMIGIASFFFLFQKNFEINARDIYVRMISFVRRVKEKILNNSMKRDNEVKRKRKK